MTVEKREIAEKNTSWKRGVFDIVCEKYADLIQNIFFVQERVWKWWKIIRVYKIRTMEHGADKNVPEEVQKWRKDEIQDLRIIPTRAWLRCGWLDELAQIRNILEWNMSIFGWRPIPEDELNQLWESQVERYKKYKPWWFGESWLILKSMKRYKTRKSRETLDGYKSKEKPNFHTIRDTYFRIRYIKSKKWKIALSWFHWKILLNSLVRILSWKHK